MNRRSGRSLQTQLTVAVGVLTLLVVGAVALTSRFGARQEFLRYHELDRKVDQARADAVSASLSRELDGRCCVAADLEAAVPRLAPSRVVLVVDEAAGSLAGSAGTPLAGLSRIQTRLADGELHIEAARSNGPIVHVVELTFRAGGTPMRLADGRPARLYVLPFPDDEPRPEDIFLGSLDRRLLLMAGLIAAAALAGTWFVARRTARPLEELRAATRDLAAGRLDRRVQPRGAREVADLAVSFNTMVDELERQQTLRRNLVIDVSHELRTPLTALQCRIETLQDGLTPNPAQALTDARDDVLHLGRLVDDLQELSLAEAGELAFDIRDVALADVVDSAVRAAGMDHDTRLRFDIASGLTARCDAMRTRQMLMNLLTNADRYTPPGGVIDVRVTQAGSEALVETTNTGSRLTPDEAARVFDRFYRTDPSRQRVTGGTGIGLAIVKQLAEAQGGRVWARSADDGVTVGFALPV